ncbi:lipid A-modifier LpxR family protein, partial [Lysobacter sp. 2RAB21]
MRPNALFFSVLLAAAAVRVNAAAAQGRLACTNGHTRLPPTINLRLDNDLFGGQDQGYSNGIQLTLVSPNLADYTDDPCIPRLARWVNRHLDALQPPQGFEQRNMIATFAQGIFT